MRGVGGPLLCIGDLLSDVADEEVVDPESPSSPSNSIPSTSTTNDTIQSVSPSHLNRLFQENYNQLTEALKGNDHSWTVLTLKLCSALETADKLIQTANSNVEKLSRELAVLEGIMKRGDVAVAEAKTVQNALYKRDRPSVGN